MKDYRSMDQQLSQANDAVLTKEHYIREYEHQIEKM